MKNKNSMTKLRNKIVLNFALVTFAVAVVDSVADSMFSDVLYPVLTDSGKSTVPFIILSLSVTSLIYFIAAILFYRTTKKAIHKESERQVREQNLLFAAIAHDLKTPMTSVQGFAKALKDGKASPEEQAEIYDIIYRKSKTMNELVNTLFEYAKYGTEEYKPDLSDVDLCVLVRDIIAENYADFEEHDIEPEFDIPDKPVIINADKQELKRALSNLIINAYKHNPDGTEVFVRVGIENGKSVVVIADKGNDIPHDMDIFEPFVTENSARTIGQGTGLGLAITKRIILRHGGSIGLSRDLKGYTKAFIVSL